MRGDKLCRELVPISEGPLSEVPLYTVYHQEKDALINMEKEGEVYNTRVNKKILLLLVLEEHRDGIKREGDKMGIGYRT